MNIHKLCKDKKEYLDLVWDYLRWILDPHMSAWKEEDYPKLKPFFDWEARRNFSIGKNKTPEPMSDEVGQSYDYYKKCREEYVTDEFNKRDAVANISEDNLLEAFSLDYYGFVQDNEITDDSPNNEPVEDVIEKPFTRETLDKIKFFPDINLSFPLIVAGFVDSDYDRAGKNSALCIDIVEKKEFDGE